MSSIQQFCQAIAGKWVQVKSENMDAINVGSDMSWVKRNVSNKLIEKI